MPAAAREFRTPTANASSLWLCAALAIGVHAAGFVFWKTPPAQPIEIEVEGESIEVSLVEPASASITQEPLPEPPPPEESPPQPLLQTPEPVSEMVAPKPTNPVPRKAISPPVVPGRTGVGDVSAKAASGAEHIGKPAYITRPSAAYPAESRTAGETGVVILRITVNADGRPTAVSVAKSSGFLRLDRAAVEGAWRCRVRNATANTQFTAPIRFDLKS